MTSLSLRSVRSQSGFTLTELMVALVLGALVVLAASAMVATSRATYRTQDEGTRVAENGRFALELVDRLVRLGGYTDFGNYSQAPPSFASFYNYFNDPAYGDGAPSIVGKDHEAGSTSGSSDSLVSWYFGSGPIGGPADGNVLDCAGAAVSAPAASDVKSAGSVYLNARERNILFVQNDPDGEPSLACQRYLYDPTTNTRTVDQQILIRGVESFQVLYGEAIYAAGADPDLTTPIGLVYRTGINGVNPVVNWANVQTVRVAFLLRSNVGAQVDPGPITYQLFGPNYNVPSDVGTQFSTATMSTIERTRIRKVVSTTILVRNRVSPWPALANP